MSLRTPLGRVRGLGSAKDGTQHWWMQRVTAVALVPLTLWLVFFLLNTVAADHAAAAAAIARPVNTVLLLLFLLALFYHLLLGLQVVIEDYVRAEWLKTSALMVMKFAVIVLAAATVLAVLRIALGS